MNKKLSLLTLLVLILLLAMAAGCGSQPEQEAGHDVDLPLGFGPEDDIFVYQPNTGWRSVPKPYVAGYAGANEAPYRIESFPTGDGSKYLLTPLAGTLVMEAVDLPGPSGRALQRSGHFWAQHYAGQKPNPWRAYKFEYEIGGRLEPVRYANYDTNGWRTGDCTTP